MYSGKTPQEFVKLLQTLKYKYCIFLDEFGTPFRIFFENLVRGDVSSPSSDIGNLTGHSGPCLVEIEKYADLVGQFQSV